MLLTTDDLKMNRRLQKQWCKCDALLGNHKNSSYPDCTDSTKSLPGEKRCVLDGVALRERRHSCFLKVSYTPIWIWDSVFPHNSSHFPNKTIDINPVWCYTACTSRLRTKCKCL